MNRSTTAGLLAAALAAASGCRAAPGDVVLVTVDTLRADHVGLYGYARETTPHLDRWFADGAVYLRAYATSASTTPSVVSLLSGRPPHRHGVRLLLQLLPDELDLVTDHLPDRYQSAAFVSNAVLTDESLGIARRFDHYDDFVDERESNRLAFERNASRTTDAALSWLREERDPGRPLFLWIHYIDPHGPYRPPTEAGTRFSHEGERLLESERVYRFQLEPGVTDALDYVDRYDEEVAYVDAQVGRLLEGYARLRSIDEALVIFTADHGESMIEHERWFTHGYHVYEEIIRVPLLLRGPGVASGSFRALASGNDVAATILEFAGVPVPPAMEPFDLRRPETLAATRVVLVEATQIGIQWLAAIQGDRKRMLAVRGDERKIVQRRAYDLGADPREERRGAWEAGDQLIAPLEALARQDPDPAGIPTRMREGMTLSAPKVAPDVSPEARGRLEALGYVEEPAPRGTAERAPGRIGSGP